MTGVSKAAASVELEQLFDSLRAAGRDDPALCVAHAGSTLLGEQTPAVVARFAQEHQPSRPRRAERPLDEESWYRLLAHPDDDPFVAKVFECVLAVVRTVRCAPLASVGLRPQDAVHPSRSSVAVVRALGAAAFALDAPVPLIFVSPAKSGSIEGLPTDPIASVAGGRVATGRSLEELAFLAGHHMARYRASQYVRLLYSDSLPEMTALFAAALRAARPSLAVDEQVAQVGERLREMLSRDPGALARLERVVQLFVDRGAPVDIGRWIAGAERTCLRAALLLGGDLQVAGRCLAEMQSVPEDALADLTTFAMSEAYFALRQLTGIALWPDRETPSAVPPEPVREAPSLFPPPEQLDAEIARAEADIADAGRSRELSGIGEGEGLRAPRVPHGMFARGLEEGSAGVPSAGQPLDAVMTALVPALQATYARTPADFDLPAAADPCPFDVAIGQRFALRGVPGPWFVPVAGLGVLWTAPPCVPTIVLVDPDLDARLSPQARAWLAEECVAFLAPERVAARMAPTVGMLIQAVLAVARATVDPEAVRGDAGVHPVARAALADETVILLVRAWCGERSLEGVQEEVQAWCRRTEVQAIAEAVARVSDTVASRDEVREARPYRPGALDASAWTAAVDQALTRL
jgi:hypothetical protein